ncbi:MAG: 30S ribosomal protein S6 [Candidatus Paceibacterota bacterium]|jgi:ribosomal protein S6
MVEVDNIEVNARVYEVGYLLVPTISEEEVPVIYGNLKELISSFGGELIFDEMPKMMNLAYPMLKVVQNVRNKFSTAYFGWTKFAMDPEKVLELKKKLDLDPKIIRFLTLKTVRENTIATKRFASRDMNRRRGPIKREEKAEESTPINKEEVDKEIEAMVAE